MKTITGIIIARNEEKMISDAFESIKFCNQLILVDNGSTDTTKEIGEKYNAEILDIASTNFSEIRNFGLSKATSDYVLYIDADERVSEQLRQSIKKVLSEDSNYSGYRILRKNFYLGNNEWPFVEKLERLFKREKLKEWKGDLHESPVFEGELENLKGFLYHFTHRDFESMLEKTIEWSSKEALLRFNSNHPPVYWWRFPRVMISSFLNSFVKQGGIKAGSVGVLESMYQAFSSFITYAKLWELQKAVKYKKS